MLTIEIGIDPEITSLGGLSLTWHGLFVALGILAGLYVSATMARRRGFLEDDIYTVALVGVPAGIIGARILFVAENWRLFQDAPLDAFRIDEGGISIYGALIGGVVAGLAYTMWRRLDIASALDVAAFGLILGMAIGRLGCLVAGDTLADPSSLPWAVEYTNPASGNFGLPPQHPAVAYEMLGDLLIFGLLFVLARMYRRDGLLFFSCLLAYSVMRFFVNFLREDSRPIAGGELNVMQMVALGVAVVSAAGFLYYWRRPAVAEPHTAVSSDRTAPG